MICLIFTQNQDNHQGYQEKKVQVEHSQWKCLHFPQLTWLHFYRSFSRTFPVLMLNKFFAQFHFFSSHLFCSRQYCKCFNPKSSIKKKRKKNCEKSIIRVTLFLKQFLQHLIVTIDKVKLSINCISSKKQIWVSLLLYLCTHLFYQLFTWKWNCQCFWLTITSYK